MGGHIQTLKFLFNSYFSESIEDSMNAQATYLLILIVSPAGMLLPVFLWRWLRPARQTPGRKEDDDRGNTPLPLEPLPINPGENWFTDRLKPESQTVTGQPLRQ